MYAAALETNLGEEENHCVVFATAVTLLTRITLVQIIWFLTFKLNPKAEKHLTLVDFIVVSVYSPVFIGNRTQIVAKVSLAHETDLSKKNLNFTPQQHSSKTWTYFHF